MVDPLDRLLLPPEFVGGLVQAVVHLVGQFLRRLVLGEAASDGEGPRVGKEQYQ